MANELVLPGQLGWPVEVYGGLRSNFAAEVKQVSWPAEVVARAELQHMRQIKASLLAT